MVDNYAVKNSLTNVLKCLIHKKWIMSTKITTFLLFLPTGINNARSDHDLQSLI